MTLHTFESIRVRRTKRGKCPGCGKTTSRTRVFEQTVNPFNRGADGEAKTSSEVREAVEADADAWAPDFRHDGCEGTDHVR